MKKARIGIDGPYVTPSEFLARVGHDYKSKGIFPCCPACKEPLFMRGVHKPDGEEIFYHKELVPDADPADDCILAFRKDSRFAGLHPSGFDDNRGKELRQKFFDLENMRLTYAFMHTMCGPKKLPMHCFVQCIARADNKNIWAYKGIPLWIIPYILLTFYSFPHGIESAPFYFYFDKSKAKDASELWLYSHKCKLVKAFSDSGKRFKSADNPFPISQNQIKEKVGSFAWVKDEFIKKATEIFCLP